MSRATELTAADVKQIARSGLYVFVLLLISRGVLTGAQFYRAQKSARMVQPELVFELGPLSKIEEQLYTDYFFDLKSSDLGAKSVRMTRARVVYVSIGVTLDGANDPRLRRVIDGLQPLKTKAVSQMKQLQATVAEQIRSYEQFLHSAEERSDIKSNEAFVGFVKLRLEDLKLTNDFVNSRLADQSVPALIEISDANKSLNLMFGLITCLVATIFIALAGGFLFGYGRLISRRAEAG